MGGSAMSVPTGLPNMRPIFWKVTNSKIRLVKEEEGKNNQSGVLRNEVLSPAPKLGK